MRYSWIDGLAVRHNVGANLPAAAPLPKNSGQGFVIDRSIFRTPEIPAGAPARFWDMNRVALSSFGSWRDVAATMRPLYEKAATVAPGSALDAELARIKSSSTDLKSQASEALRVVQQQVRYFARMDGLGGYQPETASEVWRARAGDCKGKTALLLALFRGLGINAEAALVSVRRPDGVDSALPAPGRFDHVLVRADIGGKTYWLDGTRLGDASIDRAPLPAHRWALPLSVEAVGLAKLRIDRPEIAEEEWRLDLDARAGIEKPAKAAGTAILRGETGSATRSLLTVLPADKREEYLRKLWAERHDWITVDKVESRFDEPSGEVRLTMTGTGSMDWNTGGMTPLRRYEANKARMGENIAPQRADARKNAAPVAVEARSSMVRQTILLPDGGKGFGIDGEPIDTIIGGIHYVRKATLEGGRFDMTAETTSIAGELSYAAAETADAESDALFENLLERTLKRRDLHETT